MTTTQIRNQQKISNAKVLLNSLKAGLSYATTHRPEDVAWYKSEIQKAEMQLSALKVGA